FYCPVDKEPFVGEHRVLQSSGCGGVYFTGSGERSDRVAMGASGAKAHWHSPDAFGSRLPVELADLLVFLIHWKARQNPADSLPRFRLAIEALAVMLIALTGHLGGILSGINS